MALIDPRGVLKCLCKNQQFSGPPSPSRDRDGIGRRDLQGNHSYFRNISETKSYNSDYEISVWAREYWSDGVMENRSYAFFLPEKITEKRKNIQILFSLPEINTPILQGVSISGRADKLWPRPQRLCRNWQNYEYWWFCHSGLDPESSTISKRYATGCRIKSGMTNTN